MRCRSIKPVGSTEFLDFFQRLVLQFFQLSTSVVLACQLHQKIPNQCRDRGISLRSPDPRPPIHFVFNRHRDILHSFTVSQSTLDSRENLSRHSFGNNGAQLESQEGHILTPKESTAIDEAIRSLEAGKGIPASEVRQHFTAKWSR